MIINGRTVTSMSETLGVAFVGGLIFFILHIPLAWMLGPLAAVMVWKLLTKRQLYWPVQFRNAGLMVLGYILGTSFTLETLEQITHQLPSMLLVTVLTILFSFLMGFIVSKAANIDLVSGLIGSVPGGLSQMIVLGEELQGVDTTVVTFMQTFRLLAVIFIVPFLIGNGITPVVATDESVHEVVSPSIHSNMYFLFFITVILSARLGRKLSLPTAPLLGPLIGTASLLLLGLTAPKVPSFIVITAQLLVGSYMGLIMNPTSLSNWKRLAPFTTGASVALVLFSLGLGWLLTVLHPMTLVSAFLGASPGGIAEMGVTAREVHAELSMVTAYQMFRVFFILFAVPPFLKWWINKMKKSYSTVEND
ncbi:MAG TPA: AbrB family transcriptional regulator [Bacillota bacterium]|nr:AbrB family transcriptional regulator [Bacillota bacterium]